MYRSDHIITIIIIIIIIMMFRCYMIGHSDRPPTKYQQNCRLSEGSATTRMLEVKLHIAALSYNVRGLYLIHLHSSSPPLLSLRLSNFSLNNFFIAIHKVTCLGCTRQPSPGFTFQQNKIGNHTSVATHTTVGNYSRDLALT